MQQLRKLGVKTKFQAEDPWVEKLAKSAMLDTNYNIMIQHLETGADILEIPKDCELQDMASYLKNCRFIFKRWSKHYFEGKQ